MMGTHEKQQSLFYVGVDLDERIPPNHPLRLVKEKIDFSFVRSLVGDLYGSNGHVSLDPTIVLKLLFLLFFDDVSSARELMRQLPYRLDYLWFLDFGLDDQVPDHSVLSKARRRWGSEAFEVFFVRMVQQCIELGLVDGRKIHADSTFVDANASNDQILKGSPKLIEALRHAFQKEDQKIEDTDTPTDSDDSPLPPSSDSISDVSLKVVHPPEDKGDPSVDKTKVKTKVNQSLISRTDPDAAVVRQSNRDPRPRYKHHRVVDDLHGVITAVDTTSGDVDEGKFLISLIDQHEQHTERTVRTAVADSKYGTIENFLACSDRDIEPHMADLNRKQKGTGRRRGIFPLDQFRYDRETNTYVCPAGQRMYPRRLHGARQNWEFLARAGVCNGCSLRNQCTRSKTGRSIKRHDRQDELDRAKQRSSSTRAYKDRRRRMHLIEGSFAHGVNHHHLDRSRWRRLFNQRVQDWLVAAVQNIGIMIRAGRRGGRSFAAILVACVPTKTLCDDFLPSIQAIFKNPPSLRMMATRLI